MNYLIATLALLSALALTGTTVSLYAMRRTQKLIRRMQEPRPETAPGVLSREIEALRAGLEALCVKVHELERSPTGPDTPAPRAGLNLNKRSQVLRLHRRGESPEQIAAALQVPRQEVDLLLKVHSIVLSTV